MLLPGCDQNARLAPTMIVLRRAGGECVSKRPGDEEQPEIRSMKAARRSHGRDRKTHFSSTIYPTRIIIIIIIINMYSRASVVLLFPTW